MTDYLTVAEVLAIHEDQIARYGSNPGIRGRALLKAALFRPQTGYYTDLLKEAAALRESLSQSHPFITTNAQLPLPPAFFAINGAHLTTGPDETLKFVSGLYEAGAFGFNRIR